MRLAAAVQARQLDGTGVAVNPFNCAAPGGLAGNPQKSG
jgi:hypothetical protein